MPPTETWRVVLASGETREVSVEPWPGTKCWRALLRATSGAIVEEAIAPSQRAAVAGYAGDRRWLVAEILAPGETSHAEVVAEVERLRKMIKHATPWRVSDPPTDEELRALRLRWAFGPEEYQGDADKLISAVLRLRPIEAAARAAVTAEVAARDLIGEDGFDAANAARTAAWEKLTGMVTR